MNKSEVIQIVQKVLRPYLSETLYAYIGGSFNTAFFSPHSDIDVVLIWPELPNFANRGAILQEFQKTIQEPVLWKLLDYSRNNIRDALKISNFRKIEIYHYELGTFQDILEYNLMPGLRYSLAHRIPLQESDVIEAFMESYMPSLEELEQQKNNLYFSLMAQVQQKSFYPHSVHELVDLVLITTLRELPPNKHKSKALSLTTLTRPAQLELQSLLENPSDEILNWFKAYRDELDRIVNIQWPEMIILDSSTIIRKHNPDQNEYVFDRIQAQRKRLQEFLSWPYRILSVQDQNNFSQRALEQWSNREQFHYQILKDGIFAGAFSIHTLNWHERSFQFGYWVDEKFEGQGLVTRSLQRLISEMNKLGWTKAVIACENSNTRSHSIASKLGMRKESSFERKGKSYSLYSITTVPGIS